MIDPDARTVTEVSLSWSSYPETPEGFFSSAQLLPEFVMKSLWKADNVPKKHFYSAARLLGAPGPMSIAPYLLSLPSRRERMFVWVRDDLEPGERLGMAGFSVSFEGAKHAAEPSKWAGRGILVCYDDARKTVSFQAPEIAWVPAGQGKVDRTWTLVSMERPLTCRNPRCMHVDNQAAPKFKSCARCRVAFYCSKECQVSDWPAHKAACGDASS